jgi:hypothetical protein
VKPRGAKWWALKCWRRAHSPEGRSEARTAWTAASRLDVLDDFDSAMGASEKKAQHEWGQVLSSTLTYSRLDVSFAEPPVQFRITT